MNGDVVGIDAAIASADATSPEGPTTFIIRTEVYVVTQDVVLRTQVLDHLGETLTCLVATSVPWALPT